MSGITVCSPSSPCGQLSVPITVTYNDIHATIQYFNVFGLGGTGIGTPEWEERELDKEMDRLGGTVPEQSFDIDDHLELDDVKIKKKQPAPYQNEDLV